MYRGPNPRHVRVASPKARRVHRIPRFRRNIARLLRRVEIVKQVRLRGPFLSLAEFVNRQLSSDKNLALAGAIQAALNEMSNNAGAMIPTRSLKARPSKDAGRQSTSRWQAPTTNSRKPPSAKSTYGLPGWTRQADVLRPIAPILSARDDTFTIRAYGDARDAAGNITARATCEATVRRTRDYVDPVGYPGNHHPSHCGRQPHLRPPLPNHLLPLAHRSEISRILGFSDVQSDVDSKSETAP
jgi:hypothetical protein